MKEKISKRKSVVIVDEDRIQLSPFITELELRGLDVRYFSEADSCLRSARRMKNVDAFVIDVMLASALTYSSEYTINHLYTGVFLAQYTKFA